VKTYRIILDKHPVLPEIIRLTARPNDQNPDVHRDAVLAIESFSHSGTVFSKSVNLLAAYRRLDQRIAVENLGEYRWDWHPVEGVEKLFEATA
jgi:hypothetical protein